MDRDTVERTVIKLINRIRMFDKSGGPASLATNLPSAASLGPWLVPPTLAVGLGVAKPAGRGVNVFLRIGEDPSRVEYHLALPIRDGESVEVEGDADCQLVYERVLVCLLLRGNVFVVEHLVDMALTYPVMNLKLLVTAMEHPSMTSQHPKMASEHGGRQTRQNPQHQASRSFLLRIQ
ncbi:hypothetical protein E4U37_006240 [Claviceps purpurea]|nr:hypothetical protein E4U37_006240 [Claviceps purpurea]